MLIEILILGGLEPPYLNELLQYVLQILPSQDSGISQFCGYVIGKLCVKHLIKNTTFLQNLLSKIFDWFQPGVSLYRVRSGIQILKQLACGPIIKLSSLIPLFIETTSSALFSTTLETRLDAFQILSQLFSRIYQPSYFNPILKAAKNSMKNPKLIHSSLLAWTLIANYSPSILIDPIDNLMSFCFPFLQNKDKSIVHATIDLLTSLGPLNPTLFRSQYAEHVLNLVLPLTTIDQFRIILPFLQHFPDIVSPKASALVSSIQKIIIKENEKDKSKSSNNNISHLSRESRRFPFANICLEVLVRFEEAMPLEYAERCYDIAKILGSAPFVDGYSTSAAYLFKKSQRLWKMVQPALLPRLINSLGTDPEIALPIISNCPPFDDPSILMSLVQSLVQSQNTSIKRLVPTALAALSPDDVMLHVILSLAVTDHDESVRLAALRAFTPAQASRLIFPKQSEIFYVLCFDESVEVKKEMLHLLKMISQNNSIPAEHLPILRTLFLNSLVILAQTQQNRTVSKNFICTPLQADSASVLTDLILVSEPLLPIYIPVLIPIAISFFKIQNDQVSVPLTFFEKKTAISISVDFINSITLIMRINPNLLGSSFDQISKIFINLLTSTSKKIVMAILNSLCAIFDIQGLSVISKFPYLNSYLHSAGARFTSNKVHSALFRVLGRMGFSLLGQSIFKPFTDYKNVQSNGSDDEEKSMFPSIKSLENQQQTVIPEEKLDKNTAFEISKNREPYDETLVYPNAGSPISPQDWYLCVAASSLLSLLEDESSRIEVKLHAMQVLAVSFNSKSEYVEKHFAHFVSFLIRAVRTSPHSEIDHYFSMLQSLVSQHSNWLEPFAGEFASFFEDYFESRYFIQILDLVQPFIETLKEGFSPYMPHFLSRLLERLSELNLTPAEYLDSSQRSSFKKNCVIAQKVLFTLGAIGPYATDHLFMIIQKITELIREPSIPASILVSALNSLSMIASDSLIHSGEFAGIIIRDCGICLNHSDEAVKQSAANLLNNIMKCSYLCSDAVLPAANLTLSCHGFIPTSKDKFQYTGRSNSFSEYEESASINNFLTLNESEIVNAAYCRPNFSPSQWKDWLNKFILVVITQSPSPVIHSCHGIAEFSYTLAHKLFYAAFSSCWIPMSDKARNSICGSFSTVLCDSETPISVLCTIVGLAEFMERSELHLLFSYLKLAQAAIRAEKITFALFCAEKELCANPDSPEAVEITLDVFSLLSMDKEAQGLLEKEKKRSRFQMTAQHAIQLKDWVKAASILHQKKSERGIEQKFDINLANDFKQTLKVNEHLLEWKQIVNEFESFDNLPATIKEETAVTFAQAFLQLEQWNSFDKALANVDSVDSVILKAMSCIKKGCDFEQLSLLLEHGFDLLSLKAGPLFAHGFASVIPAIVQAEQLVEIGEFARSVTRDWNGRTKGSKISFQTLLPLYAQRIVLKQSPEEVIEFLKTARKAGEWVTHDIYFEKYLPDFDIRTGDLNVSFECILSQGRREGKEAALNLLTVFQQRLDVEIVKIEKEIQDISSTNESSQLISGKSRSVSNFLSQEDLKEFENNYKLQRTEYQLPACHLLNKHRYSNLSYGTLPTIEQIVCYPFSNGNFANETSTDYNERKIKLHMEFLRMKLEKIQTIYSKVLYTKAKWLVRSEFQSNERLIAAEKLCSLSSNPKARSLLSWIQTKLYNNHVENRTQQAIFAIEGFAHCVLMECGEVIPEMQQLASILFRSGKFHEVFETIEPILERINTDKWLIVSAQLLAQMNHQSQTIASFAIRTISKCLKEYPSAIIFPLLFASRFSKPADMNVAKEILLQYASEKESQQNLVERATTFYDGLLAASETRLEKWIEGLNAACEGLRLNNIDKMHCALDPLYNDIDNHYCEDDKSFNEKYQNSLENLNKEFGVFYNARTRSEMTVCFEMAQNIIEQMNKEASEATTLAVASIAPQLINFSELLSQNIIISRQGSSTNISSNEKPIEICLPGTFNPQEGHEGVNIVKVGRSMQVFASKQRPKKLTVFGSDGKEYWYLLKGHEDLRLDQRVMEVLDLINTFIKGHIPRIVTYTVMPISPSAGLIQWIPETDTFSQLIKEHRLARQIPPDLEARKIAAITIKQFDKLRPIQRLEALEKVARETSDSVLADALWLKSPDTESWVRICSNFAQTSGLMSISGYILGLGDRHPSNLMIRRNAGTVIHIDLGDCFDVTKERLQYPELIPFRLTRFMIRALGPSGVEGPFRSTCEEILKVLRHRRESLMAVLEIFVHDPITIQGMHHHRKLSMDELTGLTYPYDNEQNFADDNAFQIIANIADKVVGKNLKNAEGEPQKTKKMSNVEEVARLIDEATNYYYFAHLYRGWNPLW